MTSFNKRQYEWLAAFAWNELSMDDRVALCNKLDEDFPNFDRTKFEARSGITEYNAGVAAVRRSATS